MIARIYRAAGWIGWFTLILMIGATAERYWSARDGHSASLAVSLLGALLLVVPPIRQTYRILPFKDVPQHEIPPQALEDPEVAAFIRDLQQKQAHKFAEFSYWDALFWMLGAALLAIGFVMDEAEAGAEHARNQVTSCTCALHEGT